MLPGHPRKTVAAHLTPGTRARRFRNPGIAITYQVESECAPSVPGVLGKRTLITLLDPPSPPGSGATAFPPLAPRDLQPKTADVHMTQPNGLRKDCRAARGGVGCRRHSLQPRTGGSAKARRYEGCTRRSPGDLPRYTRERVERVGRKTAAQGAGSGSTPRWQRRWTQ